MSFRILRNSRYFIRSKPIRLFSLQPSSSVGVVLSRRQEAVINHSVISKIFASPFCRLIKDRCWSCNTDLPDDLNLFCPHCKVLQKVQYDLNHFEILGITQEFSVHPSDLTKKFRQLQSLLHPDKFSNKSTDEKSHSDDWSALVNRAYKTLMVPLTRAEYLLQLNGVAIPEDNSVLDAEFLMEMMEKNEEIEEADTEELLLELITKTQTEIKALLPELEDAFGTGYFEQAIRTIIRMRYLYSIENSIKAKGQRLGVVLNTN